MTTRSPSGADHNHAIVEQDEDGYEVLPNGVAVGVKIRGKKYVTPRKYLEAPTVESPVPSVSEITDEIKKAIMYTLKQTKGKTVLMDPKERAGILSQLSRSMNLLTQMEKMEDLDFNNLSDAELAAAAQRLLIELQPSTGDEDE